MPTVPALALPRSGLASGLGVSPSADDAVSMVGAYTFLAFLVRAVFGSLPVKGDDADIATGGLRKQVPTFAS